MKNFLIGLVVGILLCGLTALIVVFAMVRFAGSFANRPACAGDRARRGVPWFRKVMASRKDLAVSARA